MMQRLILRIVIVVSFPIMSLWEFIVTPAKELIGGFKYAWWHVCEDFDSAKRIWNVPDPIMPNLKKMLEQHK